MTTFFLRASWVVAQTNTWNGGASLSVQLLPCLAAWGMLRTSVCFAVPRNTRGIDSNLKRGGE
jgi:hypothetical protein